jgi:hypothetical protein
MWNKWNRLKRKILTEDVPLWNKLIQKNSGLQLGDLLMLMRKRKYYDSIMAKLEEQKKQDEEDEIYGELGPLSAQDINRSAYLEGFTEDHYYDTYWIVKMFGSLLPQMTRQFCLQN